MRYRKPQRKSAVTHADDWLMTYADMITLLLCFFAIFLAVSVDKKETERKLERVAASVPVDPPKPPDTMEGNLPLHGREHAQRLTDDAIHMPNDQDMLARSPAPDMTAAVPADPQYGNSDEPSSGVASKPYVVEEHNDADLSTQALSDIINNLKAQGPATIEQKGDRLTTMEMDSGTFFDKGSATLSDAGKQVLLGVAANIKSDQYKDYQVTVEGHTDDTPIKTAQFPSNWELSTARAAAVVKFFIEQGIPAQRLRAAGYADTFPKVPNSDADGKAIPENQAQNRRVVIKLEKVEKRE